MEKKIIIVCLLIMLITACSTKSNNEITGLATLDKYGLEENQETEIIEHAEETKQEITEKIIKTEPEKEEPNDETVQKFKEEFEETITEAKESSTSPVIRNLLSKTEDIKSYSFLYGGPETAGHFLDTFICLGADCSKTVINFYKSSEYNIENYFDTAYISEEGVFGCCLNRKRCITIKADNTGIVFEVEKSSIFAPKTPVEWLYSLSSMTPKYVGKSVFDKRTVEDFEFSDGTYLYRVKFDERYGIPHLIEQFKGEERINKYHFSNLQFNNWKEEFFAPACKEN